MGLFKKAFNYVKNLFGVDTEEEEDKRKEKTMTSTPIMIKTKEPSPTFEKQTFISAPEGEGAPVKMGPGPTRERLSLPKDTKVEIVHPTEEGKRPETKMPPRTAEKIAEKRFAEAHQPEPTLGESTKKIGKELGKGLIEWVKNEIAEDKERTIPQRLKHGTAMTYNVSKEIIKLIPMIPGFVGRQFLSASQSVTKPEEEIEVPKSLQFAFGEEPIKSFQKRHRESKEMLKKLGATDGQAGWLAPTGVALMTLADIDLRFPGRKKLEKQIMNEIGKVIKDNATKEFIQAEARRISKMPRAKRQAEVNKTIANILDDGSDAFATMREAREIADLEYKYGDPVIYLDDKGIYARLDDLTPEQKLRLVDEAENIPISKDDIVHLHQYDKIKGSSAKEVPLAQLLKESNNAKGAIDNVTKEMTEPFEKRVGSIGLDKFEVPDVTKKQIVKNFKQAGIENKIPQTERQWLEAAKQADLLDDIITPQQVEKANGMLLKTEQRIASIGEQLTKTTDPVKRGQLLRESIELTRVLNAELRARGQMLRAARTKISGEEATLFEQMIKDMAKHTDDVDRMVDMGKNIDFTNQKQVNDFYRKFVKPTFGEIFTEYRYNNMLSNPRTQMRNLVSNIAQTIITRPTVKLTEAALDLFIAPLTGKQKTAFFRDVPKFYYGVLKSIPEGFNELVATFRGNRTFGQQDIKAALGQIPTGKLPRLMTIPSRTLEAVDRFLQTLIKGGEISSGKTAKDAARIAEYSLFRAGLDPKNKKGQGILLSGIDNVTSKIDGLRKVPGGKWFIPFLRTPMNFAKMWVEYSPAGLLTLPGSQRKKEQLAKTLIGSTITAMGAQMAWNGDTTWGVPRDPEARSLFYASGKKPFSVKINDQWVPMMYLGPWAFALALPAAVKFHSEDDPSALTDSTMDKLMKDASALAEFYSQQTFMEGIGNFVDLFSGDSSKSVEKNLAFVSGQALPMQGLMRYISTIIDPIYRKSNTFLEAIESTMPFLSKNLEPHTLPTGEESRRNIFSYIAPYDITRERPEYDAMLKIRNQELQSNAVRNEMDKETKKRAAEIVEMLNTEIDDEKIMEGVKELKDNPSLKSAVKSMFMSQAKFQMGTVEPYAILEPRDRAELIHTKITMAMDGGDEEEKELTDLLEDLKDAGMWGDDERKALKSLLERYPLKNTEEEVTE